MNTSFFTSRGLAFGLLLAAAASAGHAQTLHVPSGFSASGIGTSSTGNVGVGTSSPAVKFEVAHSANHVTAFLSGFAPSLFFGPTSGASPEGGNPQVGIVGFSTFEGAWYAGQGDLNLLTRSWGSGNSSAINFQVPSDNSGGYTMAMRILRSGNVGIGTSSPSQKLHVYSSGSGFAQIEGNSADMNFGLVLTNNAASGRQWSIRNAGDDGRLTFRLDNGSIGEKLTITAAGLVGVGTTSPWNKLHVYDGSVAAANSDNADFIRMRMHPDNNSYGIIEAMWDNSSMYPADISISPNGGNVGIGTTSPSHKLAVNGTIRAKEVIVDTGWSDYVFADDYRLAPLSEVEAHIKEKKHLPNIPSAAEVEAGGVSLGDVQSKLLAKVEELTLHLIAQEKRIQNLEAENAQLKISK